MSKKEYFVMIIWMMLLCLSSGLLTGCGVEDKALTITPLSLSDADENVGEKFGADAHGEVTGEDGAGSTLEPEVSADGSQEELYVHVCGAVLLPGVVKLPVGSRAGDALEAVGGFAEGADTDYVNLAARLEDGQQLYFPTKEEAEVFRQAQQLAEEALQQAQKGIVNINTADVALLCTLPGIGEARARAIIDYREQHGAFEKPEDIMQVPGIKESAYAKLCDKITVE